MPYGVYNIVHLTGLVMVFLGLGGLLLHGISGGSQEFAGRKLAMATHGSGMILALVGGFGMHAKIGSPWQGWLFVKLGLWLAVGGLATVAVKKPSKALWWVLVGIFALAAYMATFKPF